MQHLRSWDNKDNLCRIKKPDLSTLLSDYIELLSGTPGFEPTTARAETLYTRMPQTISFSYKVYQFISLCMGSLRERDRK